MTRAVAVARAVAIARAAAVARAVAVAWLVAAPARADVAPSGDSPLTVSVTPILGEHAPASEGTTTYAVVLENGGTTALNGDVYLTPTRGLFRDVRVDDAFSVAAVWLPAEGSVTLELVAHGPASTAVDAVVLSAAGQQLALGRGYSSSPGVPHVVSVSKSGRLSARLDGVELPPLELERLSERAEVPAPPAAARPELLSIRATRPIVDRASGSVVLPGSSWGYASATLVVIDTDQLVTLPPEQLRALLSWVLMGGSLAVNLTRDTDLVHPALSRMFGAEARTRQAQPAQLDAQPLRLLGKGVLERGEPASTLMQVDIPEVLRGQLRGFVGGNLQPSPWGANASYGLGEVSLLGFDANLRAVPGEPWLDLQLLDLVGHAWDRRRTIALPHGSVQTRGVPGYSVREFLRRSSQRHWAISAAAVLLIGYAVVAGPVNFRRAVKKKRPLAALVNLALLSFGALLSVLALGAASRGTSDRARHLTLLDAASGMPVAAATRFRALQASSFEGVVVQPTELGGGLSVMNDDDGMRGELVLGSEPMRLENLRGKPWQTLYVREDSLAPLGRGVTLHRAPEGSLGVTNRIGRDLAAVLLKDEAGRMVFFDRVPDGAAVSFDSGKRVEYTDARSPAGTTPLLVHQFDVLVDEIAPGCAQAWDAIEDLRQADVDWWPADVPVLLAQVVGGEGHLEDSGIELDSDRVLLRVTGLGGTP